ncbi:helix-turn-helix transcriptional regulator [Acidovorax carolinensis]|uniref:Helix-turn-helix transcriptional regulator n=1 Tax=Acidovorax carolinensis TaxID=553814 RepID=A0A240UDG2_9BURK|nr:PAS and helix-turn-helix domain-containing protein [Acidovorax carolinensis]ART54762.1 helix-turn-helix transcriptional regulator [Acidovorax carolinensis]ART59541.1 helix-turn-helix transcriptional regulator [Acidovorax carolinensis]
MNTTPPLPPLVQDDLLLAFDMAPVGLLVSRNRLVQSCNQAFSKMFGYATEALAGESLARLYPSTSEFEHIGDRALAVMRDKARYSDERIMRRIDGQLFWCHVSGQAIDRNDPFSAAVWMFEDISEKRPVTTELTGREREIAQFLVSGKSSKEIGRLLGIGYRTVDAHRARLMRKFDVTSSNELVAKLVGRG